MYVLKSVKCYIQDNFYFNSIVIERTRTRLAIFLIVYYKRIREKRKNKACFNSLSRCISFFCIEQHKMTRQLLGEILTVYKTTQYGKFIFKKSLYSLMHRFFSLLSNS